MCARTRNTLVTRVHTWEAHVSQPADGPKKVQRVHLSAFCVHRHPATGGLLLLLPPPPSPMMFHSV